MGLLYQSVLLRIFRDFNRNIISIMSIAFRKELYHLDKKQVLKQLSFSYATNSGYLQNIIEKTLHHRRGKFEKGCNVLN